MDSTHDDAVFADAIQGLERGDFSRLESLFEGNGRRAKIIEWYEQGRFRSEPNALAEALTCACFLGWIGVAEYLLRQGLAPSGGAATGLDALHWAVNRGQLDAVRLLINWKAPLETRNRFGGTVLGTAVWSAINEPRPNHLKIIEELLLAGSSREEVEFPTGDDRIDDVLRRYEQRSG